MPRASRHKAASPSAAASAKARLAGRAWRRCRWPATFEGAIPWRCGSQPRGLSRCAPRLLFLAIYLLVLAVSSTGSGRVLCARKRRGEVDALNLKAAQLYQARNYAEAMLPARAALALAEQRFAPQDARLAKLLNNIALLHEMLKQYAEAEPFYRRALSIEETALGPADAAVGKTLKDLAGLYARQKRFAEAEPRFINAPSPSWSRRRGPSRGICWLPSTAMPAPLSPTGALD